MQYPNLAWAIDKRRLAHWELCLQVKIDPSRFSRCVNGRFDFAPHERQRISEALGFPEDWLFAVVMPPRLSQGSTSKAVPGPISCAAGASE